MKRLLLLLSVFISSYCFSQFSGGNWTGNSILYQNGKILILDSPSLKFRPHNLGAMTPLVLLPVRPSETSQINFNLTRSWTANPFGEGDEVVNFGFNAGTNASPEVAGKGAMFWSMEQGYRPSSPTVSLWEWHQEFVNFAGTNRRISSFTINNAEAANPDIDYYMTASRFYIKSPVGGVTQFSIGDFNNTTSTGMSLTTSAWTSQYGMNASGLQIVDAGGTGAGRQFEVDGFGTGSLGGQFGWVAGAQSFVQTGAVGTNPFNIKDGSSHNAYLYNSGANGQITLSNSGAGNFPVVIAASSTSAADYAMFNALNDVSGGSYMYVTGSTYAGGTGGITSNQGIFRSTASNGMAIWADTGPIKFAVGSTTEVARFNTSGHFVPGATATYDLGTSSLLWRSMLGSGAQSNGHVNVSGTGTYSALATDYTIEFTGTTATLAYPTLNLVNGRHLNIINYGSGALTIPSTKTGNATTITTLASNGRLQVEYDLANTTWIQVN